MRVKLGNNAISIHNEFKIVKVDQAPSYSTIQRWVKHFKEGKQQLKDKARSGRPITATTRTNIELVRNVIDDNPYCSYDEIEAQTSLSRGTIQNIINNELKLKKIVSRFVPYNLSEKNKKDRVLICRENLSKIESGKWRLCDIITGDESWFYWRQIGKKQSNASWVAEGEKPRVIVRQGSFEAKTMVCIFFKTTGVKTITYWDRGKIIEHKSYIDNCLKPLISVIKQKRMSCGIKNIKFHHDNFITRDLMSIKA